LSFAINSGTLIKPTACTYKSTFDLIKPGGSLFIILMLMLNISFIVRAASCHGCHYHTVLKLRVPRV
jgi:hypothetical protein